MRLRTVTPAALLRRMTESPGRFQMVTVGRRRLDEGWALPRRVVPHHMVFGLESGVMTGHVGAKAVTLSAGGLLWAQPGIAHGFTVPAAGVGAHVMYCRFAFGASSPVARLKRDVVHSEPNPQGIGMMQRLMLEQSVGAAMEAVRQRAVVAALLCHLLDESASHETGRAG